MMKKKRKRPSRPPISGMIQVNVRLPEEDHEKMVAVWHARRQIAKEDVKLCSIYREALEQYLKAKPQQRLWNDSAPTA